MSNNINYYDLFLFSPSPHDPQPPTPTPFFLCIQSNPIIPRKKKQEEEEEEEEEEESSVSTLHQSPPSFVFPTLRGTLKLGMVSIRRRKLLGLCAGRNSFLTPLPKFSDNGYTQESRIQSTKPVTVHPLPSIDFDQKNEKPLLVDGVGSFYPSASAASGENHVKPFPEVKRRKRHRRKHSENQETCLMRGVYFKNMKWQAAIKVDKKQIHLGTVGSQEEAARLYDRAAFMCGREPNFELPEDEKQELSKFNWEEFLAFTRSAINNKKHRRTGAGSRRKSEPLTVKSDWESEQGNNGLSVSEDGVEPDTPES